MENSTLLMFGSSLSILFYALCLYFTLTFFYQLKEGDLRRAKQTKLFAVLSLICAFASPIMMSFITMRQMMNF